MHSLAGHHASVEFVTPFRWSGARGTPFNERHRKLHDEAFVRSREQIGKL